MVLKKQWSKENATYLNDRTPKLTPPTNYFLAFLSSLSYIQKLTFLVLLPLSHREVLLSLLYLAQPWIMISFPWTCLAWDQTGIVQERKKKILINDKKQASNKPREKRGFRQSGLKAMVYSPHFIRNPEKKSFVSSCSVGSCMCHLYYHKAGELPRLHGPFSSRPRAPWSLPYPIGSISTLLFLYILLVSFLPQGHLRKNICEV